MIYIDLVKRFETAIADFNAGDVDKYATCLADDAELWPPQGPAVIGKQGRSKSQLGINSVMITTSSFSYSTNSNLSDIE